jgi:Flp pilus assembly pilin Flp
MQLYKDVNQHSSGKLETSGGVEMMSVLHTFLQDENGQDLIEYTLLLAFVCLASAALFISAGGSVAGIWTSTNTQLSAANTSAS